MNRKLLLFGALAAMFVAGCNEEDNPAGKPAPAEKYTISVTSGTGGAAVATVGGAEVKEVAAGTNVILTATAEADYRFVRWNITGTSLADPVANPATLTMPEGDVSVMAEFESFESIPDVVIDGVKWATCNVDSPDTFASDPQSAGMFYQWNRFTGWSGIDPLL
jgi:hypothetical protein